LTIAAVNGGTTIESLSYLYDAAGNRTKLTRANAAASLIPNAVSGTAYDAANEQTQFAGTTLTYDLNGNLTYDGTNTYMWNVRNQLTAISGGVTASFAYDGLGRRSSKTINSTTTGFWYDGDDVLAELSGSTPTATYIRSLSIDEPFIRKSGSDEFYQGDALGSTLTLTDGTGTSQASYGYESFGKTTITGSSTNSFQFTGRENDGTGVAFYRARYYSPTTRRFIADDPIECSGGSVNLYLYVRNKPGDYIDPTGLLFWGLVDAGEAYGESAAQFWADMYVQSGNPIYWVPGALASLWTRKSSDSTFSTIAGGAVLGRFLGRPFWQYYPANNSGYTTPWFTRGWGWRPPYPTGQEAVRKLALPPYNPGTAIRPINPPWWRYVGGPQRVPSANGQPGGGWQYRIGGFTE
jgi:RHS repeat-associated protein